MKLTVLMENTGPEGLVHEHGLSLYFEHQGGRYLLDAGSSGRFVQNAAALRVDLRAVDAAVLSHGHYDHADGLVPFFALNGFARVYVRPAALQPQHVQVGPIRKFIGVKPELAAAFAGRFDLADGPREIAPGLHLIPDSVDHEQSVVAETPKGLIVMNSCCHAGVDHIVEGVLDRFPGRRVHAVVGGFHLMGLMGPKTLGVPQETVPALARRLIDELGVDAVYTGHCTGAPGFALLDETCPGRFHPLTTGLTVCF